MPAKVGLLARYMTRFHCQESNREAPCGGGGGPVPVEGSTRRRPTALSDDEPIALGPGVARSRPLPGRDRRMLVDGGRSVVT